MTFKRHKKSKRWHLTLDHYGPLPNLPAISPFGPSSAIRTLLSEAKASEIVIYRDSGLGKILARRVRRVARTLGIAERNADEAEIKHSCHTNK